MANRRRGEVAAIIAGERWTLCLTLGGLAELEDAFGVSDLSRLGERFSAGRLSSRDLATLLAIALRGGGHPVTDAALRDWPASSLPEMAEAAAALLSATFGETAPPDPTRPQEA